MRFVIAVAVAWCTVASGCYQCGGSAYMKALEKVGMEKRDLLVKRVTNAKEAQVEAQQQFRDSLQEFQTLVGYKGGELEARYEKVRASYEASTKKAQEVRDRISGIKKVSEALFSEWEQELGKYSDSKMRAQSASELKDTRKRAGELVATMEKAASKMDPVLEKLEDQVLFLKHNLNARALGSLKGTADALQVEVNGLIKEMETSIREADTFIAQMKTS
jgi:ElaB/YqjD/DUF883 family membrane-anchored ribosome-binding protein